MASVEYILKVDSKGSQADFKLKYKNGRFFSIQQLRGKLTQEAHERLLSLAPQLEAAILILEKEYSGRVSWEKVEKEESLYQKFVFEYCTWYELKFNIQPLIKAADGAAIKWIITNIGKLTDSDQETFAAWKLILDNWDQLDEWYRNQTDLLQIQKNLNIILKQLKHGKSSEQSARAANNVANDFRSKL